MLYHSRTMSDRRFKCYTKNKRALIVAQRTCDEEVLYYVSNQETVRVMTKGEGISQRYLRYQGLMVRRVDLTRYSGIFE